jgi:hypothetical protein
MKYKFNQKNGGIKEFLLENLKIRGAGPELRSSNIKYVYQNQNILNI